MTQPNAESPAAEQVSVPDVHVAPPHPATPPARRFPLDEPPPEPATTLGQTPHEPTVRPWELELLISGALVFSMLQIPGQLDAWFHGMDPKLDSSGFLVVFIAWYYLKLAVYALAGGFAVHLAIRGYWVGVIGLEAVFPKGIAWEKSRGGPIIRQLQRERTPTLQTLIDRADRLASMVFGAAFALAMLLVFSLFMGGAALLVAWAVSRAFFTPDAMPWVMEVVIGLYAIPILLASLADKRIGQKVAPDSRTARVIRRVGGFYTRMQGVAPFTPLMMTLATNLRGRRGARTVTVLVIVGGIVFVLRDMLMLAGGVHFDGYTYLPEAPGAQGVLPDFYADRRGGDMPEATLPYIQSDIVRDPYVRLFIPYRPRRHNALLERRCPVIRDAVRAGGLFSSARPASEAENRAVLACMAALQPVTLDGRRITPDFRFAEEAETGIRGMVAYIPVAGLPKGGHVLAVAKLPLVDPTPSEAREPRAPFSIPFWL